MMTWASKSNCHTGNPLVFEALGVKVYAGGNSRDGGWMKMKEMPDLAIGPTGVIRTVRQRNFIPEGFSCASHVQARDSPRIIEIEWPDFSVPSDVGREFWVALVADILNNDIKSVSCQCVGGHGRTGVQLCILAHMMIPKEQHTWNDAAELIRHIRDLYCTHAVEGKSQQKYIADVLEIPVGEDLFMMTQSTSTASLWTDAVFDPDEIEADDWRSEKKPKKTRKKNGKAKAKPYFNVTKGVRKSEESSNGYAITCCTSCDFTEIRRNNKQQMKHGCAICDEPIDMEFSELQLIEPAFQRCKCRSCKGTYHELEMYTETVCKACHLSDENPSALVMKNGGKTPKDRQFKCEATGKTWPLAYTIMDDDGSLISVGGYGKDEKKKDGRKRVLLDEQEVHPFDERQWGI